jgi:hypothetical protein
MMARRLLSVLLAIVIALIVVGFFLPREVLVQRSVVIDSTPEIAFDVLNELAYFNAWSPWFARNPDAEYRLEGPGSGTGSTLAWSARAGDETGRLRIIESLPHERIELRMELGETESEQFFRIQPVPAGVEVAWGMRMRFGALDLTGRYIGLMLPSLVGGDLRRGMDQLKVFLERHPGTMPPRPEGVRASDFSDAIDDRP